jgi:hypothetical protein
MRLCVDRPQEFWSQVWACRGAVSQAAQAHHVDTKLLDDQVAGEFAGHSFLHYAKDQARWRWTTVLLFCNYAVELVLRLQWQQAIQLISGLMAQELLWKALELNAAEKTTCLQSLVEVFKQLPDQLSDPQEVSLTYDVNYWRPAFEGVHDSIRDCYTQEFRHRWYRRVWVGDEARYLERITKQVEHHDRCASQRWGWWHRLVGWWKGIGEKRRLLQLKTVQHVLADWSKGDELPTPEAIDEQLMLGCELKISERLKKLQRLSLQQHERRGASMARRVMEEQAPSTQDYNDEILSRLALYQDAFEKKGCAVVTLYFQNLVKGEVGDLALVWEPMRDLGKLFQEQLSDFMADKNVPPAERDGYKVTLDLYRESVFRGLVQMVEQFSPNVTRLYEVKESLVLPKQTSDLTTLLTHYSQITSFEAQARSLCEDLLRKFDEQGNDLNTAVKDKLLEEYTLAYQDLKESYWEQLEHYENNLAHHLQLFCTEHKSQLLSMAHEEQRRARNAEPAQEAQTSLRIQERSLDKLSQVTALLSDMQPKFSRLAEAKRDLITYQRHCQISLIGLKPQLASLGQCERNLSWYLSANRSALKAISQTKVPVLSKIEEFCKAIFSPHQPREVLIQALSVVEQHWGVFAQAHELWHQLAPPIRMRLSCEMDFRSALTLDTIKDKDEVWLHYPRARNHFLFAYDDTKKTWTVLGRDSQGQVHRFDLDLRSEPWKSHQKVFAYFVEGKARYTREYYEQVLCYPLLKQLAKKLGEPLFEFCDAADQAAYYPQQLAAHLQKEFSRIYEKQVLPALSVLYQARAQLRRARTLIVYATKDCEASDPAVARSWPQLSRSMISSTLPEFPSNPCRILVPYSAPSDPTVQLQPYASLTPDEKLYEDFHRAVFDYLQLFCRFEYKLVEVIRAHQCESMPQWHEGVKENQQLQTDWQQLNRQYKQVWLTSHPDKIASVIADIHPKARDHFLNIIQEYRKDIGSKHDLLKGIFENCKGFEAYLRESYILGMEQGAYRVQDYIDMMEYYQQRDYQHYALGDNLKCRKEDYADIDRLEERAKQLEVRVRELEAQLEASKAASSQGDEAAAASGPKFFASK